MKNSTFGTLLSTKKITTTKFIKDTPKDVQCNVSLFKNGLWYIVAVDGNEYYRSANNLYAVQQFVAI